MKKYLYIVPLLLLLSTIVPAQKLNKPKQMPNPETTEQQKVIQQGIVLHDAKKYDEAIAKYLSVLAENPDSTTALYELALSYSVKGDKVKARETAVRGAAYISDELALFYELIASDLDDQGKPDEAIKIYRDAEDILKSYPDFKQQLASVHYNLGVTYVRQKKFAEARVELKKAAEGSIAYPSPHFLLSLVYNSTKYPIPAFLAAVRFISLEHNTNRTARATAVIAEVLKPAPKDPKTGNINIFLNLGGPKDEGDYGMYELLVGTLTTFTDEKDKGKKKTRNEQFVDAVDSLIAMLTEDKKLNSTFVGKNYLPYAAELKKKGYVEVLAHMVLYINDSGNADAAKWIKENDAKLNAFLKWAKEYKLPAK